jgi:hypothetical protein
LEHALFIDGNQKRISWVIKTQNQIREQVRDHADIYLDKVSDVQSKYIALHVGIFWGIGVFVIKNEDVINVMLDSKPMYEHLSKNLEVDDSFIKIRSNFYFQLVEQRKLKLIYHLIESNKNLAKKLL